MIDVYNCYSNILKKIIFVFIKSIMIDNTIMNCFSIVLIVTKKNDLLTLF